MDFDYDADQIFTTDVDVIVKNVRKVPTVICKQKPSPKIICEFDDFVRANINGFGDEIGAITNKITAMFGILEKFEKDSDEYKELEYRIICGQLYQQNAIDKIKAIIAKPMPTEWYQYRDNITKDEDGAIISKNMFNINILADKKPYFFIYNYKNLNKDYNKFNKDINIKCINKFGMEHKDLLLCETKTDEMINFLEYYHRHNPVEEYPSTMNKVCRAMELAMDGIRFKNSEDFDYTILKTPSVTYTEKIRKQVEKVYNEYLKDVEMYVQSLHQYDKSGKDEIVDRRELFKQAFINDCATICDDETLCNVVLDMCYNSHKSKQFAWDISGEQILRNLLKRNNYTVRYPSKDDAGEIDFCGERFTIKKIQVEDTFADNY